MAKYQGDGRLAKLYERGGRYLSTCADNERLVDEVLSRLGSALVLLSTVVLVRRGTSRKVVTPTISIKVTQVFKKL